MRGCSKVFQLTAAVLKVSTPHQTPVFEAAASDIPRALRGSLAQSSQQSVRHLFQSALRSHGASSTASSAATSATAFVASNTVSLSLPELLRLYKQLSKHRLSALVVSTAAAGYIAGKEITQQRVAGTA